MRPTLVAARRHGHSEVAVDVVGRFSRARRRALPDITMMQAEPDDHQHALQLIHIVRESQIS